MKKSTFVVLAVFLAGPGICSGQVGGNIGYSESGVKGRAEQQARARRTIPEQDQPPTKTSTFVEADVLMNVVADEYVAVFGIAQSGETVAECSRKMDAVAKEFTDAVKALGVSEKDLFLDFVTQTKIYGFEIAGDIAREKLVGFELKKNLSIHYRDRDLLDQLTLAAARSKIDDLIKVEYVVKEIAPIQDRLMDEAAKVIKQKADRYDRLLGIKLVPPQVYAEKYGTLYPSGMYDSYTAAETEVFEGVPMRQRYTVQSARKGRTFVFNALDSDGFDRVINPVIIEPVVQFTLHLKVKYEVEQAKAR